MLTVKIEGGEAQPPPPTPSPFFKLVAAINVPLSLEKTLEFSIQKSVRTLLYFQSKSSFFPSRTSSSLTTIV